MSLLERLRYARLTLFQIAREPISARARKRRFQIFRNLIDLKPNMRILDVGGSGATWEGIDIPLKITILNLPGHTHRLSVDGQQVIYVEGDGCSMPQYAPGDFDLVFSNSVIEHVGPRERQVAFANEVLRLRAKYWVQTPSKWFPIEAHCGMPFWFFYPAAWRRYFIDRWRSKLPDWTEMVEHTRVLEKRDFAAMFPGGHLITESLCAIPKSYVVYATSSGRLPVSRVPC